MKKLNKIPKKTVFDTPENYFENLSQEIQKKIALKEKTTWQEECKPTIFDVPQNYFEDLAFQVQTKIQKKKRNKIPLVLWGQKASVWALGSVLLILALGVIFWNSLSGLPEKNMAKNTRKIVFIKSPKAEKEEEHTPIQLQDTLKMNKEKVKQVQKLITKPPQETEELEDLLAYEMLVLPEEPIQDIDELLENSIQTSDVMEVLAWNDSEDFTIYEDDLSIYENDFTLD